jgi:hypothetical protein
VGCRGVGQRQGRGGEGRFVRTESRFGLGLKSESRILIRTWTQVRKIPAGAHDKSPKVNSDQVRIGQSKSQFGPGPEVRKSNPKSESKVRKIEFTAAAVPHHLPPPPPPLPPPPPPVCRRCRHAATLVKGLKGVDMGRTALYTAHWRKLGHMHALALFRIPHHCNHIATHVCLSIL